MMEEQKARVRRYGLICFGVIITAYFFVYFHRMTSGAISETLESHYGIGTEALAGIASAYLYAYMIMQLPGGLIIDKWGARRSAAVFSVVLALGSAMCAVSAMDGIRSYEMMIAGRAMIGAGAAVVSITGMKIEATWFRSSRFATLSGLSMMVGNLGAICAAYPMVASIDAIGLADTYWYLTLFIFLIGVLIWIFVKDSPSEKGLPEITELYPEEYSVETDKFAKVSMKYAMKEVFTGGMRFWPIALWLFLLYGVFMLWNGSYAGPYYEEFGMSQSDYSVIITMIGIGMMFGSLLSGILSDRVFRSRKKVVIAGTAGFTLVWSLLVFCGSDPSFVCDMSVQCVVNFLIGFFASCFVVCFAQVKELFPLSIAGTATSAVNLFPFVSGAIFISVAGYFLRDHNIADYTALWTVCLAMLIVSFVLAMVSKERKQI